MALTNLQVHRMNKQYRRERKTKKVRCSYKRVHTVLRKLGGECTAVQLCEALVKRGFSRAESQLAIQRAMESGAINVLDDWTLITKED